MSIDAKQLRAGNYVLCEGKPRWVWGIFDNAVNVEEEGTVDITEIYPIPITPKVLLACGFKAGKVKGVAQFVDSLDDIDPSNKHKYTYYWDLRVPENNHVEDLRDFSLVQWGKGTDIYWGHQQLKVKVKYLHQLQNLFFSLTNKELIYKPKSSSH